MFWRGELFHIFSWFFSVVFSFAFALSMVFSLPNALRNVVKKSRVNPKFSWTNCGNATMFFKMPCQCFFNNLRNMPLFVSNPKVYIYLLWRLLVVHSAFLRLLIYLPIKGWAALSRINSYLITSAWNNSKAVRWLTDIF